LAFRASKIGEHMNYYQNEKIYCLIKNAKILQYKIESNQVLLQQYLQEIFLYKEAIFQKVNNVVEAEIKRALDSNLKPLSFNQGLDELN
jgi:hypothetical protein